MRCGVRAGSAVADPARTPQRMTPSRPTAPSEGFQGLRPWRASRGQSPLVGSRGKAPGLASFHPMALVAPPCRSAPAAGNVVIGKETGHADH